VLRQLGREALGEVVGVEGALEVGGRRTAVEGRVAEHSVEAFAGDGSEEIAVTDLDPVVDPVEQEVEAGAADRLRVDVHRHHSAGGAGGGHGERARSGAQVEHRAAGGQRVIGEVAGEHVGGQEEGRVEDPGKHHQGKAEAVLEHQPIVTPVLPEPEAQPLDNAPQGARHRATPDVVALPSAWIIVMSRAFYPVPDRDRFSMLLESAAAMRPKVVLFNPRAVFWTMPLGVLAVGSALDCERYRVVVVDGRLDTDDRLLEALEGALCLGIGVLTGRPLGEAMRVTDLVRERYPDLPIVWGGWHPSLYPGPCIVEGGAAAVVVGQGERSFAEIVDRLADGDGLEGVAGCWRRDRDGRAVANPSRAMEDLNRLPPHDYGLIDVEAHFRRKGRRQLDYVTSQGCRFRCAFCADPSVYGRGWSGLEPARVTDEVAHLHRRFGFTDLAFQDETFFTGRQRVAAIAEGLLDLGGGFTWTATLRADQGRRLSEEEIALCRASGLREVVLGVESGSPETLRRIRKDITLDDVRATAETLLRHDIGAAIGVIVGFPDEPEASVLASLAIAAELAAMSPSFRVSAFTYQPYPGSALVDELGSRGAVLPRSLEEWSAFDYVGGRSPFLSRRLQHLTDGFRFFGRLAFTPTRSPVRWPVHALARWRVAHNAYGFAVDRRLIEWLRPGQELS
jgi:anaerobic magnesium-protoporphyrin IX monomethyl ester cyclase